MQENNRTELERLDRERKADLLNMVRGFVLNQVNESSSSVQWDD